LKQLYSLLTKRLSPQTRGPSLLVNNKSIVRKQKSDCYEISRKSKAKLEEESLLILGILLSRMKEM
jgi:hypothetical protein